MTQRSEEAITNFVALQCAKRNAHDKHGYLDAWNAIAPDGITFEDPVGTPPNDRVGRVATHVGPIQSVREV